MAIPEIISSAISTEIIHINDETIQRLNPLFFNAVESMLSFLKNDKTVFEKDKQKYLEPMTKLIQGCESSDDYYLLQCTMIIASYIQAIYSAARLLDQIKEMVQKIYLVSDPIYRGNILQDCSEEKLLSLFRGLADQIATELQIPNPTPAPVETQTGWRRRAKTTSTRPPSTEPPRRQSAPSSGWFRRRQESGAAAAAPSASTQEKSGTAAAASSTDITSPGRSGLFTGMQKRRARRKAAEAGYEQVADAVTATATHSGSESDDGLSFGEPSAPSSPARLVQ